MTFVLGLTGGIATGKSAVVKIFKASQIPVVDSDLIVHRLQSNHSELLKEISFEFGAEYLLANGDLNRKKLADLIFYDQKAKERLARIQNEKIRFEIEAELNQLKNDQQPLVVVDIPLLYEENYQELVDQVMVVVIPHDLEVERLMHRNGITKEKAEHLIEQQLPLAKKKKLADIVLDNSGTIADTKAQVNWWLKNYQELPKNKYFYK